MEILGWVTLALLVLSGSYYAARNYARHDKRIIPHIGWLRKYHHLAGMIALFVGIGHAMLYKYPTLSARAYSGYVALAILAGMAVIGYGIKLRPRNKNFRMLHRASMILLVVAIIAHLAIKKIMAFI